MPRKAIKKTTTKKQKTKKHTTKKQRGGFIGAVASVVAPLVGQIFTDVLLPNFKKMAEDKQYQLYTGPTESTINLRGEYIPGRR